MKFSKANYIQMKIREFSKADVDVVLSLWRSCAGIQIPDWENKEKVLRAVRKNAGLAFVAIVQDELVGTLFCGDDGYRVYMHHLAVKHEFRNCGIGEKLLKRAIDEIRLRAANFDGARRIMATVESHNEPARKLIKKLDWHVADEIVVQLDI